MIHAHTHEAICPFLFIVASFMHLFSGVVQQQLKLVVLGGLRAHPGLPQTGLACQTYM